jgi:hypothetical protein
MSRTNQILAAVLVVQILLGVVFFWPSSTTSLASGESLFAGLQVQDIARLTITDGSGNQIQLVKSASIWVLPQSGDFPAQGSKVPDLLEKIIDLKADRMVTQTASSHKQLKVADSDLERKIVMELTDGTTHNLYLGTSPSYGTIHVRAGGRDEVYLSSKLSASDAGAEPSNWVDTLYLSVPQDQITALKLENQNGTFEFEKDDDGVWHLKDLAADEVFRDTALTTLVSRFSSLRMTAPLGTVELEEYGLQNLAALVTVQTKDSEGTIKTYTLEVGAKNEQDGSHVIISSESPYYVQAASYIVQDFVEKTRIDFLELPPTPEPTPGATP